MAQQANIVAFDGESTPVSHTFVADHVEYTGADLQAFWQEKTAGVPEYAQGSLILSRRKVNSGLTRIGLRVNLPVMESVSGANLSGYTAAPKVAYTDAAEYVQWVHPRSLSAGRKNVKAIVTNILRDNASTAAAISTGPLYDACVQIIFPN